MGAVGELRFGQPSEIDGFVLSGYEDDLEQRGSDMQAAADEMCARLIEIDGSKGLTCYMWDLRAGLFRHDQTKTKIHWCFTANDGNEYSNQDRYQVYHKHSPAGGGRGERGGAAWENR